MAAAASAGPGHPSPARARVSLWALLYGLAAAPLAWIGAELMAAGVATRACFPKTEPLATPAFGGVQAINLALMGVAIAVAGSAAAVALGAWRRTRDEQVGGNHTLLEVGEGRTRFLALAGVLTSCGFALAILFAVAAALLVPPC